MKYEFAPMEGITGYPFRKAHAEHFPGIDAYYTPFIAANSTHSFKSKEKKEIDPANGCGTLLVPQILTNDAEAFLWTASSIRKLGYNEVNFNLGCPSSTVVTHGKGSGFLADPDRLDHFFENVFEAVERKPGHFPEKISIKTRIGIADTGEAARLIEIYNRYPFSRVIVHPRLRSDFYKGDPRMDAFRQFYEGIRHPLTYNGDIRRKTDAERFSAEYPKVDMLMIGRGLLMNPALVREIQGGKALEKSELQHFHNGLLETWKADLCDFNHVLGKLKEIWFYMGPQFENADKPIKKVKKARNEMDYRLAVQNLFSECDLLPEEKRTWRP